MLHRTLHMFIFAWLLLVMATLTSAKPIFVGYYSTWRQAQNELVDYSKYTHINIAFAIAKEDGSVEFPDPIELPELVKTIQGKGPKVLVSVGGWTGSKAISDILADKTKSAKFTSQIIDLVDKNKLDGIDIDWEHPGKKGLECNSVDLKKDTPRFSDFLKELRGKFDAKFGKGKKLISLAVGVEPFHIDEKPSTDVGEIAKSVDYASIMAFDINGAWSKTTGPNAPLKNEKDKGDQFSLATAIEVWTAAKWPANKLVVGLPFYGRALTASADMSKDSDNMYQPKEKTIPMGDWEDAKEEPDAKCGVEETYTGQWLYQHLRESALTDPHKAHKDWIRTWDKVSETPWLFNPKNKTFITYDDPISITAKVKFAAGKGLAGAMAWAIDKDFKSELINAAHAWPGGSPDDGDDDDGDTCTSDCTTGDSTDTGDKATDTGDTATDTGDTATDTGDTATDTGDTATDTGDTATDTGDTATDTGDKATDTDDNSTDTTDDPADTNKGPCSEDGKLSCTSSGSSPDYTVCIFGSVIKLQCGTGSVCVDLEGSIYCGWKK